MKTYIGTKQVRATPMTRKAYNELRGWKVPADECPDYAGYLVEYLDSQPNHADYDGYISWSPAAVFEQTYHDTQQGMTFGAALVLLKQGELVARNGWNGKGMWLLLVKGECVTEPINDCYGDPTRYECGNDGYEKGQSIPVLDAIYMKTADNKLVPWLASQTDMLVEDWVRVE